MTSNFHKTPITPLFTGLSKILGQTGGRGGIPQILPLPQVSEFPEILDAPLFTELLTTFSLQATLDFRLP
jgi:hypothetical protein